MHVKITTSGSRRYVQLVESYRDDSGRVKKRTVATLGRLDQLGGELDSVISGLLKVAGREPLGARPAAPSVTFESARALGDVGTHRAVEGARFQCVAAGVPPHAPHHRHRGADPGDGAQPPVRPGLKLGVLRWLETVALPGVDVTRITHQQLLRSMDALMDHQAEVDAVVAGLLRPLIDQDLSVVFYDLTTIRSEGLTTLKGTYATSAWPRKG